MGGGCILHNVLIKCLTTLQEIDLDSMIAESREEGFRFLDRLVADDQTGVNSFDKPGEVLYGVYLNDALIGIGGMNQDPYSPSPKVGRLRRFYIKKCFRRQGIGRMLVQQLLNDARTFFEVVVLRTDTEQADQFYQSLGFIKGDRFSNSTHYLIL
ncbi:GNAT family N-acetyltransferase [Camelliibacillus cellulosilyticus]|uniref:GNAT family N-acetyltransferase n=1 Tax=Camelliibacillus cellulosilyticus TaxID=2174486 RepID=A0ABV9GNG4_9BACL